MFLLKIRLARLSRITLKMEAENQNLTKNLLKKDRKKQQKKKREKKM
jgi:hypothetical protein